MTTLDKIGQIVKVANALVNEMTEHPDSALIQEGGKLLDKALRGASLRNLSVYIRADGVRAFDPSTED